MKFHSEHFETGKEESLSDAFPLTNKREREVLQADFIIKTYLCINKQGFSGTAFTWQISQIKRIVEL